MSQTKVRETSHDSHLNSHLTPIFPSCQMSNDMFLKNPTGFHFVSEVVEPLKYLKILLYFTKLSFR